MLFSLLTEAAQTKVMAERCECKITEFILHRRGPSSIRCAGGHNAVEEDEMKYWLGS
jgi:hypothetical protein